MIYGAKIHNFCEQMTYCEIFRNEIFRNACWCYSSLKVFSRISHWDRYLGMMTAMTQVPVPTTFLN